MGWWQYWNYILIGLGVIAVIVGGIIWFAVHKLLQM